MAKVWSRVRNWFKRWLKKIQKTPKLRVIALAVLIVIVVAIGAFVAYRILSSSTPENKIRQIADDYYTEKIETATKKSSSYTLILKNMKQIGYDVDYFEKEGCSLDSYVIIYLNEQSGESADKNDYRTETKLINCE